MRNGIAGIFLLVAFSISSVFAQTSQLESQNEPKREKPEPAAESENSQPVEAGASDPSSTIRPTTKLEQPKRILGIIPNYRAVSADTQLPALSPWKKFTLATQDSFDYSSFIYAGMLAGVAQAESSVPEFGQGALGYGRYYWHSFADLVSGNYLTEFIVPAAARQDPRYYTLGHGNFFHRTGYALSRLAVTRTDSGHESLNFSEIVGNGAAAGLSNLYYPGAERTWVKTYQKWTIQIALDGASNIIKEFWPDISAALLRKH